MSNLSSGGKSSFSTRGRSSVRVFCLIEARSLVAWVVGFCGSGGNAGALAAGFDGSGGSPGVGLMSLKLLTGLGVAALVFAAGAIGVCVGLLAAGFC